MEAKKKKWDMAELCQVKQMLQLEFNVDNFNKLVILHMAAIELAELGYKVSQSGLSNVSENLKMLHDRLYQFRNERFANPLKSKE